MVSSARKKTASSAGRKDARSVINQLASDIIDGDRRSLARAITLIESTRTDHRRQAEALVSTILPETGKSLRLGISGVPGVG